MKISVRYVGHAKVVEVAGDVDLGTSPVFRRTLFETLPLAPKLALNLEAIKYIDSSGVASLVETLKASRDVGSRLILIGLSASAREVLQLSRLLKIFEIYDKEEEALAV